MMSEKVISLEAWKGRLQTSKQGVKKNMTNLMLFLANLREFGGNLRWNELAQRAEWNGRPIEDADLVDIKIILEAHQFDVNDKDLMPAILRHSRDNNYHPVREYLNNLQWDGKKRLDKWLSTYLGCPDDRYNRAIGRKSLIAAVARAYQPGCKVDTMLVLEGPQGLKKSSAISTLFGDDWSIESVNLFDQHNKMVMTLMGAWVVELAEFVAIAQKNQNLVKGMISMRKDKVVLSYGKIATEHPRQFVFIGTINPDDFGYLTDTTGNRRYWFARCSKIDLGLIRRDRDQIWAEAAAAYCAREQWWLNEEEEALSAGEASERQEEDVWEDILRDKLLGQDSTSIVAALRALGMPDDRMGQKERNRAGRCLRRLGFMPDDKPSKDENRQSVKKFRRGE